MRQGRSPHRVIDLGCGNGVHRRFVDDPAPFLAFDHDPAILGVLRARYPDYACARADGHRLPLADRSVDQIVNVYNLEHMPFLDHVLEEMARVLAPGGEAYVSVPNEGGRAWSLGRALTSARHFRGAGFDYSRVISISHIHCVWELEKAVRRHFRILQCVRFPTGLPSFHLNLVTTWRCGPRAGTLG